MMIHFHVLRSAAWSNLNISTSGLMQSSQPPNPPAVRKGSLLSVFTALHVSFSVSHQSLVCWGHRAGTEQKRKRFYVISAAVFRPLVWSPWQAAPPFSFPRGTFVGSPHHPVPFPRRCAVRPPETPLTTTPLTHHPHNLSLLRAPHL